MLDLRKVPPPGPELTAFLLEFGRVRARGWADWIAVKGVPDPWFVEAVETLEQLLDAED